MTMALEPPTDSPASGLRALGSRGHNISALFETVLTRGPLSRRDVARLTGLSAASVTKLVKPMITHGYLVENDREAGVPGRPQIPLQVDPARHYAVGIKLMHSRSSASSPTCTPRCSRPIG